MGRAADQTEEVKDGFMLSWWNGMMGCWTRMHDIDLDIFFYPTRTLCLCRGPSMDVQ